MATLGGGAGAADGEEVAATRSVASSEPAPQPVSAAETAARAAETPPTSAAATQATPITTVVLFYKYAPLANPEAVAAWQRELTGGLGLAGRVLVATEGLNGTLAGSAGAIATYCEALRCSDALGEAHARDPIDFKMSTTVERVLFPDMSVKVCRLCHDHDAVAVTVDISFKAAVALAHLS